MSDLILPAVNGHEEVRFSLDWNSPVTLYRNGGRVTMQELKRDPSRRGRSLRVVAA